MARYTFPPIPPIEMPPARTLIAPGRGELFLRDTGGDGPVVMLLHGWVASADLNWCGAYYALAAAGYRVLAIDHRGHGRGLRPLTPFRMTDCAGDAAAALRVLDAAPAIVVGYSMGGAIAQLMARDHPDAVSGLLLSGTAQHWQDPETRRAFRALGLVGLLLTLAPRATWSAGLRRTGMRDSPQTAWVLSEMMRHSVPDIVEAGRELGRFDSRPWLAPLPIPTAVVLTSRDSAVPPRKQHELASAVGAEVFEAPINHLEITTKNETYNPVLLRALAAVGGRRESAAVA
ncbi:MAG TPA: alpha/beta hydrolase [Solirubrobacteraceae bacterium]|nr:alpha/beta hydrolase [Solirubrobacteraceae bacterium]